MARKNEKPTATDEAAPAGGETETGGEAGGAPPPATGEGEEGVNAAAEEAQALVESLRKENEQLHAQVQHLLDDVDAIAHSRDAALQERDTAKEEYSRAKARRSERKLLPELARLSSESQRAGDLATHAALERVIVALAEARHAVREGVKTAKGDGLDLLEDLQESL